MPEEWKSEDFDDLESVSSGGEPGDSRGTGEVEYAAMDELIRGRMREAWR
jgi:hypothetical protein